MANWTRHDENMATEDDSEMDHVLGFSVEFDTFPIILAVLIGASNAFVLFLVKRASSLRTVTNVILSSLAFSDLLNGVVGIPLYLVCSALQTTAVCGVTQVLIKFYSISIVLHLVLVSADRYIAVVHAIHYRSLVTRQRALYFLIAAWASALFVALIQLTWVGFDVDVNEDSDFRTQMINTVYDAVCLLFFFVVPLIAMVFCYVRMFIALRQQLRSMERNSVPSFERQDDRSHARERRAALIFIAMITIYIVCWLPYFMLNFQHEFGNDFFTLSTAVEYVFFYYPKFLNSLLNPLLYVFGKHDFRQVIHTFRRRKEDRSISLSLQNTFGKISPSSSSLALRTSPNSEQPVFPESAAVYSEKQSVTASRC